MAKISLFIQLLESFTKQFIKDVGRAPKTRNELMSIQDDVVRYLNKKKGVPEGPKKPPFQGFTPEVIQGGKSKEGIKTIPVDEQFTTKRIHKIDDELDNLSTKEGKYGNMNRNDRDDLMIKLQDESSTLQETFNVKSPLVQDDALRIKQGLSTRIKLNSENENAQMVKDLILRKNKEFNSLDRTQQKEILDRIQNQIKESKAKSATNVNPDDEMPFASGGMARVGMFVGGSVWKKFIEQLFMKSSNNIRQGKGLFKGLTQEQMITQHDNLTKMLKKWEMSGRKGLPEGAEQFIGMNDLQVTKAIKGATSEVEINKVLNKAYDEVAGGSGFSDDYKMAADQLSDSIAEQLGKNFDDLSEIQKTQIQNIALKRTTQDLKTKLSKPTKTLEGLKTKGTIDISNPEVADEFTRFIKESDPKGYKKLEQQIQSDDLFYADRRKTSVWTEEYQKNLDKDVMKEYSFSKKEFNKLSEEAKENFRKQLDGNYASAMEDAGETVINDPRPIQSDDLFDAEGKLNKKAVLQEVKDSEEKMLLDKFDVKGRTKQASGGRAGSGLNYLLGEDDQNVRTPYGGLPGLLGE